MLWHWFITLSYKLQEITSQEVAIQISFCKVAGKNGKKLLPETFFLNYQKWISPMDVFIILQLSANDIEWKQREENNNIIRNSSKSDILALLTLPNAEAKSASTSEGSVINQSWNTQFRWDVFKKSFFRTYFLKCISISLFFQYRLHVYMKVNM